MADILIANEIMAEMVDHTEEYKQFTDYINNPTKYRKDKDEKEEVSEHEDFEYDHDER